PAVPVTDGEVRVRLVDVDGAFRADHLQPLIDLKRGPVGQAPDVLQHAGRATVEAVHGPAEVGVLHAAVAHRLGVGADHLRAAVPEHQVGVVDAVADDRADLVEQVRRHPRRDVAAGVHRDDLPDASFLDGGPGGGVARVEAADVADHEIAAGHLRSGDD